MRTTLLATLGFAIALNGAPAQQPIPVRTVAPVVHKTTESIVLLAGLRQLPDGRLLVNDARARRLLVFDATLSSFTVTADSTGSAPGKYSSQMIAGLYPYAGDSTLWADYEAQAFIVIGPDGKIARTLAPPKPRDLTNVTQQYGGKPGTDPQGRFIYRAGQPNRPPPGTPVDTTKPPSTRDTIAIVRADFDARTVDTIATFTAARGAAPKTATDSRGKMTATMFINPVPEGADDWAVLSDGSVAVVRAHDYHIDWLYADGTRASTPKMPFDWRRLTDEDKKMKIDSVRRIADSLAAAGRYYGTMFMSVPDGNGGFKRDTIHPAIDFVPLSVMSDYVQPLRSGLLQPDEDGNLWILPTTSSQAKGGLLYDVVNKKGELFERVQLPADRAIAGFGRGGVVYLVVGDRTTGYTIEKTRVLGSTAIRP